MQLNLQTARRESHTW